MKNKFTLTIIVRKIIGILSITILSLGITKNSFAQERKVDLNALILETQKLSQSAEKLSMVWWIPEDYWRASFEQNSSVNPTLVEAIIKSLRPYIVIVALDGEIGSQGGINYKSKESIQSTMQIIDAEGNHYFPLANEKIDSQANIFLSLMKPVFANMAGPMGENMNFYLFPSTNEKGINTIDAKKEGKFSVLLDKTEYKWKLPLSSLLASKLCPIDNEVLNGTWKFCPMHGVELNRKYCPIDKKRFNSTYKFCPKHGVELN
jgi:hypothetical protein